MSNMTFGLNMALTPLQLEILIHLGLQPRWIIISNCRGESAIFRPKGQGNVVVHYAKNVCNGIIYETFTHYYLLHSINIITHVDLSKFHNLGFMSQITFMSWFIKTKIFLLNIFYRTWAQLWHVFQRQGEPVHRWPGCLRAMWQA